LQMANANLTINRHCQVFSAHFSAAIWIGCKRTGADRDLGERADIDAGCEIGSTGATG
jgi:hypothetical protein